MSAYAQLMHNNQLGIAYIISYMQAFYEPFCLSFYTFSFLKV